MSDDMAPSRGESGFALSLSDDVSVVTRSTPAELGAPVAADFRVRVENSVTGRVVYDDRFKEFVAATNGNYTLTATYGEDVPLGIDCPYYKGVATAAITPDKSTPQVVIACHVANALVSVRYSSVELFEDFFEDYSVQVTRGNLSVELTSQEQSAYMQVGATPQLVFVATLRDTDRRITFPIESEEMPAALNAADHLVLNLALKPSTSGVVLDVEKAVVEHVTIEETLPLEWLPAPKMSFSGDEALMRYEDEDAPANCTYTITTAHALQDVEIVADFTDARLSALNGTHLLSELTEDERGVFAAAGIVLPVIGEMYKNYQMNLNQFVKSLQTNDGAITHNKFGIRVKANDRWNSETTTDMTVEVKRLRLTLPTQTEGDAWTETLYITPVTADNIVAGEGVDVNEVLSSLFYEVSSDGGQTWTAISTSQSGDKLLTRLTPGTVYQLRAHYPNTTLKSNVAEQAMEEKTVVPNGDFEDLRGTYSDVTVNAGGSYSVWPANYQNTATFSLKEPAGWASVNPKTCSMSASSQNTWYVNPSTYNTGISWSSYRSFGISTENNPDPYKNLIAQHGSNAMVLRNVGWDMNGQDISRSGGAFNTTYYNTNVPTVSNRSSGKLFLGSYSYRNGAETYNEGVGFGSRPTALDGYYKYTQDGDNSEYGTVTVTLMNGDKVLGRGTANLNARSDYGMFSVPITYIDMSVHPTSLRIMFTSSRYASYTQAEETAGVKCVTYNNTRESAMRGATLTVDNLIFTYDK